MIAALLAASAALTGCKNEGGKFAEQSAKYGLCVLAKAQSCSLPDQHEAKVEKASVTSQNDAIRVSGVLKERTECENYAAHANLRSPDYISQAMINKIVVRPYGEPLAVNVDSACAAAPYNVSLTVAKSPAP